MNSYKEIHCSFKVEDVDMWFKTNWGLFYLHSRVLSWQGVLGLPGSVGEPGLIGQRVSIPNIVKVMTFLKRFRNIGLQQACYWLLHVFCDLSIRVSQAWKGRLDQMDPMEPRQVETPDMLSLEV